MAFDGPTRASQSKSRMNREQRRGIMGVEHGRPTGMAFVFDEPTDSTFWMKDTLITLSIAFVDETPVIVVRDMGAVSVRPARATSRQPYVLASRRTSAGSRSRLEAGRASPGERYGMPLVRDRGPVAARGRQ